MSTQRRHSVLNFVIFSAALVTVGALLSPLAIAWWQRSSLSTPVKLSGTEMATLRQQASLAEKALLQQPNDQVALKTLVNARLQLVEVKGATTALEKLATLNPQVPTYRLLAAQGYQYLGDRETAVIHYRQVLTSQPQNLAALQGLATVLVDGNKPEAALGIVQEAIKTPIPAGQSADLGALKLLLGQIYVSQKRYGEALPLYDEIVQANGQDFRPLLAKAIVFKQLGNLEESQQLLNRALEVAPAQYKDQIQTLAQATIPRTIDSLLLNPTPSPSGFATPPASTPATPSPSPQVTPGN